MCATDIFPGRTISADIFFPRYIIIVKERRRRCRLIYATNHGQVTNNPKNQTRKSRRRHADLSKPNNNKYVRVGGKENKKCFFLMRMQFGGCFKTWRDATDNDKLPELEPD